MRQIDFTISAAQDGKIPSARITLERKVGDQWKVEKQWDVKAGTPEATRRLLVLDGERLIVEQVPSTRLVYDKQHNLVTNQEIEE